MNITILLCRVEKKPVVLEVEKSISTYQNLVGGTFSISPIGQDTLLVYDDEFLLKNSPFNKVLELPNFKAPLVIKGDFFIVGDSGESFKSLTPEQIRHWRSVVATSMSFLNLISLMQAHSKKKRSTVPEECIVCGSSEMTQDKFATSFDFHEASISGSCQVCQNILFKPFEELGKSD